MINFALNVQTIYKIPKEAFLKEFVENYVKKRLAIDADQLFYSLKRDYQKDAVDNYKHIFDIHNSYYIVEDDGPHVVLILVRK